MRPAPHGRGHELSGVVQEHSRFAQGTTFDGAEATPAAVGLFRHGRENLYRFGGASRLLPGIGIVDEAYDAGLGSVEEKGFFRQKRAKAASFPWLRRACCV